MRKGARLFDPTTNYGLVFEVGLVVVDEFVVVVPLLLVVVVEFVVETVVFVFVTGVGVAGLFTLVLAGLLVALLVLPASPQAIPKALRANTDESAITFFILIQVSCLLQRINLTYFYLVPAQKHGLPQTQSFFEANATIEIAQDIVNPRSDKKRLFLKFLI